MIERQKKLHTRLNLAKRIKLLRLTHGWSQETLAVLCQLHRTYIGAVERAERNISLDNVEKIAAVFEISVSDLLADSTATDIMRLLHHWRVDEPTPVYLIYPGERSEQRLSA